MNRAALLSLAVAGILIVVAGCGGGDGGGERLTKDEYQQQANAIGQKLEQEFGDFTNVDPSDIPGLIKLMATLGTTLHTAGDEFGKLSPPEEVQAAQDKAVSAIHDLADTAGEIGDKLENAKLADLVALQDELDISKSDAFAKLQEAAKEFSDQGYDLGSLGG